MEAIIFIGHGSRTPKGNEVFLKFISEVLDQVDAPIKEYCFFERYEPTLEQAIESCVLKGGTEIVVIPVFLLPGVQSNEEIPAILEQSKEKFPHITINYGEPVGNHPIMVNILKERIVKKSFSDSSQDAILLVTHGSHDPQADKEFKKLAEWFSNMNNCSVEVAYLTTSPLYKEKAEELLQNAYNKIYVVPYLLFTGGFLASMEKSIETHPNIELCDEIGYDEKLKGLLIEKTKEFRKVKTM